MFCQDSMQKSSVHSSYLVSTIHSWWTLKVSSESHILTICQSILQFLAQLVTWLFVNNTEEDYQQFMPSVSSSIELDPIL